VLVVGAAVVSEMVVVDDGAVERVTARCPDPLHPTRSATIRPAAAMRVRMRRSSVCGKRPAAPGRVAGRPAEARRLYQDCDASATGVQGNAPRRPPKVLSSSPARRGSSPCVAHGTPICSLDRSCLDRSALASAGRTRWGCWPLGGQIHPGAPTLNSTMVVWVPGTSQSRDKRDRRSPEPLIWKVRAAGRQPVEPHVTTARAPGALRVSQLSGS
jgi:hypothetical protein